METERLHPDFLKDDLKLIKTLPQFCGNFAQERLLRKDFYQFLRSKQLLLTTGHIF